MAENKIPQPSEDDYIFAQKNPEWLNTPSPFESLDNEWYSIIIFYVFHVPVSDLSARAKNLDQYGWGKKHKNSDYKLLKRRLIQFSQMNRDEFQCIDGWAELKEQMKINSLEPDFPIEVSKERVVFRKIKSGENDSLLAHIRHSFAHGRLSFYQENNEIFVAMEDIDKKGHISARMILSKQTLLHWKSIIELGPSVKDDELDNLLKR